MFIALTMLSLAVVGCGDSKTQGAKFPSAQGTATVEDVLKKAGAESSAVMALAGNNFVAGKTTRVPFALLDEGGKFLTGKTALYLDQADGSVVGPIKVSNFSLAVPMKFQSKTTASDPDSSPAVSVANLSFKKPGRFNVLALTEVGGKLVGARSGIPVRKTDPVPAAGARPPKISTPTRDSVRDIKTIETRIPADPMHNHNFRSVVGKGKPVVLVFATPALCTSRVCGPVVDVTYSVRDQFKKDVIFIHQEIYNDNDANKGYVKQVGQFGLPGEPYTFVIDQRGRVAASLQGPFGASELTAAIRKTL